MKKLILILFLTGFVFADLSISKVVFLGDDVNHDGYKKANVYITDGITIKYMTVGKIPNDTTANARSYLMTKANKIFNKGRKYKNTPLNISFTENDNDLDVVADNAEIDKITTVDGIKNYLKKLTKKNNSIKKN